MADDLQDFHDKLSAALDQLLAERDAALVKGEMSKVSVAEAEAERLGTVLASLQFFINTQQAANMNAVAARIRESIESQRAIGLMTAFKSLEKLIKKTSPAGSGGTTQPGGGGVAGPIRAKPGKHEVVVNHLIAGAIANGLDPMAVLTFIAIESDFNPTAQNPVSSAGGLFQFIDSTWISNGGSQFPGRGGIGNGHAAAAPLDEQVRIGCKFTADNAAQLTAKLGRAPTVTMLYMAHQQGLGGALKILSADQNAPIESVISADAASKNGFGGMTVGQTIRKFNAVVRSNEDEALAVVIPSGPAAPQAVASLAAKAVSVALNEMEMFARRSGAVLTEKQDPLAQRVLEYFRLVGRADITDPSAEPWSAAFISYVMHTAGATATQFPVSPHHARYILFGLANRMANRMDSSLVYFDRNEIAPKVGDLVGFSRTAQVRNRSDIERFLPEKFFPSHTDLVVDVSAGKIKTIGGNLSQTIKTTTLRATNSGLIDPGEQHFFVLRSNIHREAIRPVPRPELPATR